jgi:DNA invertase Pin-like site-specific DNA recombinase
VYKKKHTAIDRTPVDGDLLPVAAYLRMSSDDQEGSIEQQRREILAFAGGKYRIVAWYVDEGKSGSKDQEKRVAFRQMILDSAQGEFRAVLCWKTNRFGRLDSQEGAADKRTLRKNGVHQLITVKDGSIDWNTRMGRLWDAFQSEGGNEFSESLASDSLRGRRKRLEDGFWPNGAIPYGYHRLYIGPGNREVLVTRAEAFRKPKGWLLRLVVCEEEAAVVRWLFQELIAFDRPLCALARDLNARGVPPPAVLGKPRALGWSPTRIRALLTDPAYVGVGYLGSGRNKKRGKFASADNVRKAGVCPVLVDPEPFERAQAILAERDQGQRKPRHGTGALSQSLTCAHCGYRLSTGRENGRTYYYCKSPGNRPGLTPCKKWRVYEDELLPRVCRRLVEVVDGELLKALEARPPADELTDLDMLRAHMATLEKQIDDAARRYLTARADLMPTLERQLLAMREELAECDGKLKHLAAEANEGAVSNFARWWRSVRGSLLLVRVKPGTPEEEAGGEAASVFWSLTRDHQDPPTDAEGNPPEPDPDANFLLVEPAALRSLLQRLGVKVKCSWRKAGSLKKKTPGRGRGPSYVLSRAVLTAGGEGATLTSAASPAAVSPAGQSCSDQPAPPDPRPSSPSRKSARSPGNPGPTNRRTDTRGARGNRTRPGARWPTPPPAGLLPGTTPASTGRRGTRRYR